MKTVPSVQQQQTCARKWIGFRVTSMTLTAFLMLQSLTACGMFSAKQSPRSTELIKTTVPAALTEPCGQRIEYDPVTVRDLVRLSIDLSQYLSECNTDKAVLKEGYSK